MKTTYNGKFLQVIEKPYNNINYEIVNMKPAVAAILVNQDFTKTLLVKQFRPVVDDFTYEIPAGMIDVDGENKIDTLIRELSEEVELSVNQDNLVHLTKYYPIVGSVTHQIDLYYAIVDEIGDKEIENDDVVERIWVNLDDFENLVNQGEIIDGKTLLAYCMMKDKIR